MNRATIIHRAVVRAVIGALAWHACGSPWPLSAEELPAAQASRFTAAEVGPVPAPVEPVPAAELEAAIGRGVAFLLESQRPDGSWGSADNTQGGVDIYAPPPGAHHAFRGAVTGLAVSALIEAGDPDPAVAAAIDRGQLSIGAARRLMQHLETSLQQSTYLEADLPGGAQELNASPEVGMA